MEKLGRTREKCDGFPKREGHAPVFLRRTERKKKSSGTSPFTEATCGPLPSAANKGARHPLIPRARRKAAKVQQEKAYSQRKFCQESKRKRTGGHRPKRECTLICFQGDREDDPTARERTSTRPFESPFTLSRGDRSKPEEGWIEERDSFYSDIAKKEGETFLFRSSREGKRERRERPTQPSP